METVISGLPAWGADAPVALRVLVGALGAVVLLAGARLAKPALAMGAFGVGAVAGALAVHAAASLVPELSQPVVIGVAACIGGLGVLVAARLAVKVALVAAGGLTGLVATGALATALAPLEIVLPWWSLLVGAVVGAALMPLLAMVVLRAVAAAVGAVLVAWAIGLPTHPWLLLGLFVVGAAVQLGLVGGRKKEAEAT